MLHELNSVEANHNSSMTFYAPSQDEESKVYKEQSHSMTCDGKC